MALWKTQAVLVYYAVFLAYDLFSDVVLVADTWRRGDHGLAALHAAIIACAGVIQAVCLVPSHKLLAATRLLPFTELFAAITRPSYYTLHPVFASWLFAVSRPSEQTEEEEGRRR